MVSVIALVSVYTWLEFIVNTIENRKDVATYDFITWMQLSLIVSPQHYQWC